MKIRSIVEEAHEVAHKYNLNVIELDRTDNIINLRLVIDNDLFIQIYANKQKQKLNLTLVLNKRRLFGYDSEGGKYHFHPFEDTDKHVFVKQRKTIQEFVTETMSLLEKNKLL